MPIYLPLHTACEVSWMWYAVIIYVFFTFFRDERRLSSLQPSEICHFFNTSIIERFGCSFYEAVIEKSLVIDSTQWLVVDAE